MDKIVKKPELLSPAGNFFKLKIALAYGADAVYGGVSHFSLRNRSGKEFTYESFGEAIKYTQQLGKKFYATINGFPFNNQLKLLKEHIKKVSLLKPDAMIVSTPGVITLVKDIAPDMKIHLSTQANVLNYLDAKFYKDIGVDRIIAAREISLRDLKEIKKEVPDLELEIFVHGSMCFAYSGRCLISSMQMGRTPNRGSCANDCRFEYTMYAENKEHGTLFRLEEEKDVGTYIFNAKDLNLASHLDEIIESGVIDSVKIEGRTKSPYYTAITARTYKQAINDYFDNSFNIENYQSELNTLKNRGYTDAYLISRPFEKNNTQNLQTAMSLGSYEISGLVNDDKKSFMCKYKIYPYNKIEIVTPNDDKLEEVTNDIGRVYMEDDKYFIEFNKIVTISGKELASVHSGNINPIMLPSELPPMTILRQKENI
jgi:putative protease